MKTNAEIIRKIEIHLETTDECMDNFNIQPYVKELLDQDNALFKEIIQRLSSQSLPSSVAPDGEIGKYLRHLPVCNMMQNWTDAQQALGDTPERLQDESYHAAIEKMENDINTCTCGLDALKSRITSPVGVSDEMIKSAAELPENSGSNYVKNHMPGAYQNRKEGFIKGAQWLRSRITGEQGGWVSAKERLPEIGEKVIAYFPDGTESGEKISSGRRSNDKVVSDFPNSTAHCFEASMWMSFKSLPAPKTTKSTTP